MVKVVWNLNTHTKINNHKKWHQTKNTSAKLVSAVDNNEKKKKKYRSSVYSLADMKHNVTLYIQNIQHMRATVTSSNHYNFTIREKKQTLQSQSSRLVFHY